MQSAKSAPLSPVLETRIASSTMPDTDVVLVFQNKAKKSTLQKGTYSEVLKRLFELDVWIPKSGSVQFIRLGGIGAAQNVLFVGMGTEEALTEEKIRQAGGNAWQKLKSEKCKGADIHVGTLRNARQVRAFAEGLVLGAYDWGKYKSKMDNGSENAGPGRLTFIAKNQKQKSDVIRLTSELRPLLDAVRVTRDWSNEPSNFGTPEYFAEEAKKLASKAGLKCRILKEEDARKEQMGLFLGVGQGAEREGRIVIVEYAPRRSSKNPKTIALVGKGVTFDSGGISIKPSARMEDMKHDMTGAATIMGAILLASAWKSPHRIVAIMGFTENMPDGNAIQPGNVLTSRSGKTVEIINTDAEGRLVLADLLDFIQDIKPDAIIDVATLTGAVSIALGKQCCAILGNDDRLLTSIKHASEKTGEKIWELPLWEEYFEDLKSESADMKNSANDSYGGTIRGAIFLKQFIKPRFKWAHLDIAATAYGVTHLSYMPKKGASGCYVRTLAQLAMDL